MSGKDERKNLKFPWCPLCGKAPKFWILDGNSELGFAIGWLLGDEYIKSSHIANKHVLLAKKVKHLNASDFAQRVYQIRCFNNRDHVFGGDAPTFRIAKNMILRYDNMEGHDTNR